jgi:hypothetical protein
MDDNYFNSTGHMSKGKLSKEKRLLNTCIYKEEMIQI